MRAYYYRRVCWLTRLLTYVSAANVCKCVNGTPQGGTGCTKHDASMCKECKTGWTLSADKTKCEGIYAIYPS